MNENRIKEYTLADGKTFTAYIPTNVNSETPVFYYSYITGTEHDSDSLWQQMEADIAQYDENAIVIIPHDRQLNLNVYKSNAVESFNIVKQDLNLSTEQFINGGFSAGYEYSAKTLVSYLKENPDAPRQTLIAVDGVINEPYTLQYDEVEALKNNNTILLSFTQQKNLYYQSQLLKGTKLPILYIVDNSIPEYTPDNQFWATHSKVAKNFFADGIYKSMIDFSMGKGNIKLPDGYSLRYYNPETGTINEITAKEASKIMNVSISTPSFFYSLGLDKSRLSALTNLSDLRVESDNKELEGHLNSIRNAIRKTNFLDESLAGTTFSSTTKVPGEVYNAFIQLMQVNLELLELIANDTSEFTKIGIAMDKIDEEIEKEVEEIDDVSFTSDTSAATSDSTSSSTFDIKNIKIEGASIGDGIQKALGKISGVGVGVAAVGANFINEKKGVTNRSNFSYGYNIANSDKDWINEFYDYDKLVSNDKQLVFKSDGYKIIVHKDGDMVTGIEHYYDYGTKEKAIEAVSKLEDSYSSSKYFDKVLQNDRYVKVLFTEDLYNGLTVSQIREKLAGLEEITHL